MSHWFSGSTTDGVVIQRKTISLNQRGASQAGGQAVGPCPSWFLELFLE
jgi:hypothetical protein